MKPPLLRVIAAGVLPVVSASAELELPKTILIRHFDGKPASGAQVSFSEETTQGELREREYRADEEGRVPREAMGEIDSHISHRVVSIRAEGAAISLWSYPQVREIVLAPAFSVIGTVQTKTGAPVSGAEVHIVHFGSRPFLHQTELDRNVPEFRTTTDAEGRYSFPGVTLQGQGYAHKATLYVTTTIGGKRYTGRHFQRFLGDSEFFGRKQDRDKIREEAEPITIYESGSLRGSVVDYVTGKPLSGYKIFCSGENALTDEHGRFTIRNAVRHSHRVLSVSDPDGAEIVLVQEREPRQAPIHITDFQIAIRPLVKVKGRLLDASSLVPPPFQLGVPYYRATVSELDTDWIEKDQRVYHPAHTRSGVSDFEGVLPMGKARLFVHSRYGIPGIQESNSPYQPNVIVDVDAQSEEGITVPLQRRPGILFQTKLAGIRDRSNKVWDQVHPRVAVGDGKLRSDPSIGENHRWGLWFHPVEKWGDELRLSVEFADEDRRKMLLQETKFPISKSANWPVTIHLPAP